MKKILIALLLFTCSLSFGQTIRDMSTHFGGNWQGLDPADEAEANEDLFNSKYLRDAVIIQDFGGGGFPGFEARYAAGQRMVLNLNWEGSGSSGGLKNHATNETAYRNQLGALLDFYGDMIEIAVIENEPANGHYFNYITSEGAEPPYTTVAHYLAQLSWAIDECHKRNIKVADGCTHLQTYADVRSGPPYDDHSERVDEMLTGFAQLDLDYVNFHFNVPHNTLSNDSELDPGILKELTDYLRERTGHNIMTNEWHQEIDQLDGTGQVTQAQTISMCESIVTQLRQTHCRYAINFGGDGGSGALVFVNPNLTLTPIGQAFADFIAGFD